MTDFGNITKTSHHNSVRTLFLVCAIIFCGTLVIALLGVAIGYYGVMLSTGISIFAGPAKLSGTAWTGVFGTAFAGGCIIAHEAYKRLKR